MTASHYGFYYLVEDPGIADKASYHGNNTQVYCLQKQRHQAHKIP